MKEGSGSGASLSAGALLGEPGGGLLCWGSGRIWGEGLRGRASLSTGALLGSLVGGWSTGDLCKALERASPSIGAIGSQGGRGSVHREL